MHNKFLLASILTATLLLGCDNNPHLDVGGLAPIIGDRNAQFLSAGQKFLNAASLSQEDEDALGQSVGVAITSQYPPVANTNLQRYVNLVGLAVASASPNPGGNWVFGVIESPDVNAFSGPNGYVFVTHGALLQMKDEAELAGVLAHEISHVCTHDGLKQIQANEEKGAITQMARADSRTAQFAAITDNGIDVITKQGYSQPQEFAADQNTVTIMAAAGYNPQSFLNFLQRLQARGAAGGGGGQAMSTHPGITQRVARISQQLQSLPPTPNAATLPDRFQNNALTLH